MHSLTRTLAAAAAALGLVATTANAQTEHHNLSGDRISIYNLVGRLKVQPTTGSQVSVDITRGGADASKLRVATGDVHGFNSLRVIFPSDQIVYPEANFHGRTQLRVNDDGTFDDNDHDWGNRNRVEIRSSGSGMEAYADLTVGVPKGQRIVVHWGVGEAIVSNVDGDVRVSVAAARVHAEHTRGHLNLETGSGAVDVVDANGEVVLDTGSGGVTINGVHGESLLMDTGSGSIRGADVDVKTLKVDVGSGGLRLDRVKAPEVKVDAGSGGIDLTFLTVVDDLVAEAGSGGVTLRLPANQSADVDIETGSGGIQSDFALSTNRFQRNHIRGTIGNGKGRIRVEAGSGSVRLLKNEG